MNDVLKEIVFDAEFDSLNPTKIHVFSYSINNGPITSLKEYDDIRNFLSSNNSNSVFIGHNIVRFDIKHLSRLLFDASPSDIFVNVIDTLSLSWYLYPNRGRHGIESWGEDFKVLKPYVDNWENLEYNVYKERCERDVEINLKLWNKQKNKLSIIYRDTNKINELIKYLTFKMKCAALAEDSGWKLDVELCKSNLDKLNQLKQEKQKELFEALPQIPIYKKKTKPKILKKKDGSLSHHGEIWYNILRENGYDEDYDGEVQILDGYKPPNPDSHQQIKNWLFSLGWEPETYKQNKHKEEVPQLSPDDPDKKGELCPSILKLQESIQDEVSKKAIDSLNGYFVISHRMSILEGFLENVDNDGFINAEIAGFTNTLRFKHSVIVNLPAINKPYGEYIRPVLIAPSDEYILCGSDMKSLNRGQ